MGKVAVLTTDLQNDLANKNDERKQSVTNVRKSFSNFLNEMRKKGQYVIHLQLITLPDDPNVDGVGYLSVTKGTKGAEIIPDF